MLPVKGELKFHQIHFAYEHGVEVLHGIDLIVNPGALHADLFKIIAEFSHINPSCALRSSCMQILTVYQHLCQ